MANSTQNKNKQTPKLTPARLTPLSLFRICVLATLIGFEVPLALALAFGTAIIYYGLIMTSLCVVFYTTRATAYYLRSNKVEEQSLDDVSGVVQELEAGLWKSKHIPLTNLITTFLTAEAVDAKLAALLGVWQLYSTEPPSKKIKDTFLERLPYIQLAMEYLHEQITGKKEPQNAVEEQADDLPLIANLFEGTEIDGNFIEKHRGLAALAVTITSLLAAAVPVYQCYTADNEKKTAVNIVNLGKMIQTKNLLWSEVAKTKQFMLETLWQLFGSTYIPEEEKAVRELQTRSAVIMRDLHEFEVATTSDFYGVMRSNRLDLISAKVCEVEKLYSELSAVQKSQYNMTATMTIIRTGFQDLFKKRLELITNATGKQSPVVVHVAGLAGHGKTEFVKKIIRRLEKELGLTTYFRNVHDDYWSNFGGQQIIVWDDIGFSTSGKDYEEFCYHTEGAPSSAVGAAISDKGKPTNARFIFVTSNTPYLTTGTHTVRTPDAYHRRRNIVINYHNTASAAKVAKDGTVPLAWDYDAAAVTMTVLKPVPSKSGEALANALGTTTEERLYMQIRELEKNASNQFKAQLRDRNYQLGVIPEDEVVDKFICSMDYLIGAPRPIDKFNGQDLTILDTLSQDSASSVEEQAITTSITKTPLFLISGPSGTGKTHMAKEMSEAITGGAPFEVNLDGTTIEELKKLFRDSAEIAWLVDDVTMSDAKYKKAAELACLYHESDIVKPKALIFTQNSDKVELEACSTEIKRRSHCFETNYISSWFWRSASWYATSYKQAVDANPERASQDWIKLTFTEFGGSPSSITVSSASSLALQLTNKSYSSQVKKPAVITKPRPGTIDFIVHLKADLESFYNLTPADILKSLYTKTVYSVDNISGRFTSLSALKKLNSILSQGPRIPVTSMRTLSMAFNNANIKGDFEPKGSCIVRTTEEEMCLVWEGDSVKSFIITSSDVRTLQGGPYMEYHKYTNQVAMSEGTIEALIEEQRRSNFERFCNVNTLCVLLETFLSVVCLAMMVYAPYAIVRDAAKRVVDTQDLKHYQGLYGKKHQYEGIRGSLNGKTFKDLEELEDHLRKVGCDSPGSDSFVALNTAAHIALAHRSDLPNCVDFFGRHSSAPIYPYVYPEATLSTPRMSPAVVYSTGRIQTKRVKDSLAESTREEARVFYDHETGQWVVLDVDDEDEPRRPSHRSKVAQPDPYNTKYGHEGDDGKCYCDRCRDGKMCWNMCESAGKDNNKKTQKAIVESVGKDHKHITQKAKVESSGKDNIKHHRRITPEAFESGGIVIYTPEDGPFEDVAVQRDGCDMYVVGMKDGFHSCSGRHVSIRNALLSRIKDTKQDWSVMFVDPTIQPCMVFAALHTPQPEAVYFKRGDVLKVDRTLAGFRYEHFGIIGPNPYWNADNIPSMQEDCLYHVQNIVEDGLVKAFIAVDPVPSPDSGWVTADYTGMSDGSSFLERRDDFQHLKAFAFTRFPYDVNTSNCETWALAMAYRTSEHIKTQTLPAIFRPIIGMWNTFRSGLSSLTKYERVSEQACVDPAGLSLVRDIMPSSTVMILNPSTRAMFMRGLGVRGRYVITVAHAGGSEVLIRRPINENGNTTMKEYLAERVWSNTSLDVALYRVMDKKMPQFRDIVSKFLTASDLAEVFNYGQSVIGFLSVPYEGKHGFGSHQYCSRFTPQTEKRVYGDERVGPNGIEYTTTLTGLYTTAVTEKGDCGSPVTLLTPRSERKIVGIHRAGSTSAMYAAYITQEKLLEALNTTVETEAAFEWHEADCVEPATGTCSSTGFPVVGMPRFKPAPVRGTRICKSPFPSKVLPSEGEPAILHRDDPRAPGYEPVLTTLKAFDRPTPDIDSEELETVALDIAKYIVDRMGCKTTKVFTMLESINGPSKNQYPMAGALERKSAAGYPHSQRDRVGSKSPYFQQGDDLLWNMTDARLGRSLHKDVSSMISRARNGHRPGVVFTYFPKDEVLKMKKITTPKTRGILASNVAYVIAYRKYFLAAHQRVQELFNELPIKIGIDPHSLDWHNLAEYFLSVGELGFDADAAAWDASIDEKFLKACTTCINKIYQLTDPTWKESDDVIRTYLHSCVEKPFVLFHNKVVQLPRGQVSGQPGTAFDNSLVNWMLCYMIYKRVMIKRGLDHLATFNSFMTNTKPAFYGDDMLITLSNKVNRIFTLDEYILHAKEFGIDITDALKTGDVVKTRKLEEMTFLKRTFVRHQKFWVGPIELASIAKALNWVKGCGSYKPTKNEEGIIEWRTTQELGTVRTNIELQLAELALHGENIYDKVRAEMNEHMRAHGMPILDNNFAESFAMCGVPVAQAGQPSGSGNGPVAVNCFRAIQRRLSQEQCHSQVLTRQRRRASQEMSARRSRQNLRSRE